MIENFLKKFFTKEEPPLTSPAETPQVPPAERPQQKSEFDETDQPLLDSIEGLISVLEDTESTNSQTAEAMQALLNAYAELGIHPDETKPYFVSLEDNVPHRQFYLRMISNIGAHIGNLQKALELEAAGRATPTNLKAAGRSLIRAVAKYYPNQFGHYQDFGY